MWVGNGGHGQHETVVAVVLGVVAVVVFVVVGAPFDFFCCCGGYTEDT